jgi:hypothetical protein
VRIRVAHFDLDEQNKVREIAPTRQSLDQWIIVRPLEVNIPAGTSATVRFAIRPLTRPSPGEHRAMIFLEQLQDEKQAKANVLNVAYRLGVAVYGYAGDRQVRTKLHGVQADAKGFGLDIESLGNALSRISGAYGVWPAKSFPGKVEAVDAVGRIRSALGKKLPAVAGTELSGSLPGFPVLPGYRRTVSEGWRQPLAKGSYKFVAAGRVGELAFTEIVDFTVN